MDRNFFLAIVLSLGVLMLWSSYESARRQAAAPEAPDPGVETTRPAGEPRTGPAPTPLTPPPRTAPREAAPAPPVPAPLDESPERRVRIRTDLFTAELSSRGGTIVHWELADFVDKSVPGEPNVVLTTVDPGDPGALATPLRFLGRGDLSQLSYTVRYPTPLSVIFETTVDGVRIRKLYEFEQDSYAYRLRFELENATGRSLLPTFEIVWRAVKRDLQDFREQALVALADASVERGRIDALGGGGFLSFGSVPMEGVTHAGGVEWAGAELRFFVAALAPEVPRNAEAVFQPLERGYSGDSILRYRSVELPAGRSLAREYRGYIGPKETEHLEAFGAGLDRSLEVGWSWIAPLSRLFAWLLGLVYAVIPNYGWAIIVLTVLVRVVTAPLTSKQMKSMKRMGEIQPKLKEIQEKYKDDRQQQSQEMMKLYRESGVNPLGGCLPLLLQFPVFIGLYYALQSSISLRQAPFAGWINDLSAPETLFTLPGLEIPVRVLPLIMGASMILQQRLTPTTMDPAQARMMMTVMPIMFTVLFYQFPSGLVLYWMVSNLLAIGHQLLINRRKDPA